MDNLDTNQAPEQVKSYKLKSFGQLFSETVSFIRKNKSKLFYFYFFPAITLIILNILAQEVSLVGLNTSSFYYGILAIILFITSFLLSIIVSTITYGSSNFINKINNGENVDLVLEYKSLIKIMPSFIFIGILTYAIFFGGTILLIVPGILLMILSTFSIVALPIENKKGVDAIVRSFELVSGRKLSVFLRIVGLGFSMLVILIGFLIAVFIVAFLASLFTGINTIEILKYISGNGNSVISGSMIDSLFKVIFLLINGLLGVISSAFLMSYLYFMYKDAKETVIPKDEEYKTKTRKLIKRFAWFGVLVVPVIFSLVVFASLNSAREKAKQASIESQMRIDDLNAQLEKEMLKQ